MPSSLSVSEASGMDLERIAATVGLRRGYVREDDASLRERAMRRITNLDDENLPLVKKAPLPVKRKSRYDMAREDGQTPMPEEQQFISVDAVWDAVKEEKRVKTMLRLLNKIDDEVRSVSGFTARSIGDKVLSYTLKIRKHLLKEIE